MKHRVYGTEGTFLRPPFGENPYPLSTSREWDDESQTYYYRARYCNPSAGRFNRRDPIGYKGGLNLYSYVQNNPVGYIDSFGLDTWSGTGGCVSGMFFFVGFWDWKGTLTNSKTGEKCCVNIFCFLVGGGVGINAGVSGLTMGPNYPSTCKELCGFSWEAFVSVSLGPVEATGFGDFSQDILHPQFGLSSNIGPSSSFPGKPNLNPAEPSFGAAAGSAFCWTSCCDGPAGSPPSSSSPSSPSCQQDPDKHRPPFQPGKPNTGNRYGFPGTAHTDQWGRTIWH